MNLPIVGLGNGFVARVISEATKTSIIGGKKVREKKGKLNNDLGKPAFKASKKELHSYVEKGKTPKERQKRGARVSLMKAHKKGHRAQGHKVAEAAPLGAPLFQQITFQHLPTLAVVESRLPRGKRR